MSDTYTAPLRDIRFVLEHIADIGGLSKLQGFEHAEPDMIWSALDEAARFTSEVIAPTNRAGDTHGCAVDADGNVTTPPGFAAAYQKLVESGWSAVPFNPEYGGHGFPWTVGLVVQEMVASANMAFSLCPMLTQGTVEAVESHGDESLRATYLENLITGHWTGTMNLTESEAGSDVGALTTKATPHDDGTYRVKGTKIFITWGEHDVAENIIHMVLARTPDAPAGTRGISLFLVPKFLVNADGSLGERNDVKCLSIEHKLGINGSPTCVMAFGENGGAVGYLVGEENAGMRHMFTMMNNARLSVGLEGLALGERSYQQALSFAQERRQGRAPGAPKTESSPIVEHPDVRRMLMRMKALNEAMRCVLYLDSAMVDRARRGTTPEDRTAADELAQFLTPISKSWPTDRGCEVTSIGIQVHGGMGYVEETGAAQHFRDVRITPIYEGTNGIQAIDLAARKLPMRGGGVFRDLVSTMRQTVIDARGTGLDRDADQLAAAVDAFETAGTWLLGADEPVDVLAGATPFLDLAGTTVAGWLMVKSAIAAASAPEEPFHAAKLATVRFFSDQVLPEGAARLPAVTAGNETLFQIEPKLMTG